MDADQTGGVKEVTVRLASKADELAILGGTRRRTRGGKRTKGSPEDDLSTNSPTVASPATVAVAGPVVAEAKPVEVKAKPRANVTLFGKKTSALKSAALPPRTQSPKLLAKRATTLKKPKFIVKATPPAETPAIADSGARPGVSGKTIPPPKRRRFTERKISLSIGGGSATTRKHKLKRLTVDAMPIAQVKSLLLRKGVLKPKASGKYPPEPMLRSLLKDYMALQD